MLDKAISAVGGGGGLVDLALGGLGIYAGYQGTKQTNQTNLQIAREQMDFNASQAAINRNFQDRQGHYQRSFLERMSNTAHQREIQDLKAAGLNPILSATGGKGASTPSASLPQGSTASAQAATPTMQDALGKAVSSGIDLVRGVKEIKKVEADTLETYERISNHKIAREWTSEQIKQTEALVTEIKARTAEIVTKTKGMRHENVYKQIIAEMYSSNEWAVYAREFNVDAHSLGRVVTDVLNIGNQFRSLFKKKDPYGNIEGQQLPPLS